MPGEIYVGGAGLTRGYLGKPALTAERFVPNPFSSKPGSRLYRTGDGALYRHDRGLEYLGRLDEQLKIRGFRIEPGEIEAILEGNSGVHRAVVRVCADMHGVPTLAAYIVCVPGHAPNEIALRRYLQEKLPDYMIPSTFVTIDELPLTVNGKLDRAALPSPKRELHTQARPVLPRNSMELDLQRVWEDVLGKGPVSVQSNFFDLGGTSILAVTLIARLRKLLGIQLPLAILFEQPTIERLAGELRRNCNRVVWSSVVKIHPGKPTQAWFWMHPLGGTLLCYYALARHLGKDRPVYGLQSRGIEDCRAPLTSIPAMATQYIAEMRTVQPLGPYFLGGASMGGAIAYEVACQLVALGLEVGAVAILDGDTGGDGQLRELDDMDPAAVLLWRYRATDPEFAAELEKLTGDQRIDLAIQREHQRGAIPPDVDVPTARRVLNVHRINALAYDCYKAGSYPGKITLFRAADGPRSYAREIALRWQRVATVSVEQTPGTHESMAEEPYAPKLAERLGVLADSFVTQSASRTRDYTLRGQGIMA
jgi:thioesterase domain-containing protein/aryl carrier-like protein